MNNTFTFCDFVFFLYVLNWSEKFPMIGYRYFFLFRFLNIKTGSETYQVSIFGKWTTGSEDAAHQFQLSILKDKKKTF